MLRVNSPEGKHLIYFFPIYSYNVFSIVSPFFIPIKRTHTDALLDIYKTYLQFVFPKKKKKSTPTYSKDLLQYYKYISHNMGFRKKHLMNCQPCVHVTISLNKNVLLEVWFSSGKQKHLALKCKLPHQHRLDFYGA